MDNNSSIPQPAIPTNTQPVQPVAPPLTNGSGGSKMVLWFVIGLVAVIALIGGIYLYLSKQQAAVPQSDVVKQTPAPTPAENLENDLNSINVDTSTQSSDFVPVDQDLKQL